MHRLFFLCAALLFALGAGRDGLALWVARTEVPPLAQAVSTEIEDRNGALLRVFPVEDGRWRLRTGLADVDPEYVEMLLAVEDKRFWTHHGVDPLAAIRAGGQALRAGRIVSGASTLTMQTVRLIENGGTGGWAGKLRQIRVALALEVRLSKPAILSLYLTHAPFGSNIEGVRAASYAWFGKPPRRLSQAEAALLVALPQAPEARRPDRHPQAAMQARDRILLQVGSEAAGATPVPKAMQAMPRLAPHATARFAGARQPVRLTLNADLQRKIEALGARATRDMPASVSAAILVADHATGEIKAYVGGAAYGDRQAQGFVDMVQAVRSPGSTLKPLIYALAFDQGIAHPETRIVDRPMRFGSYAPQNFDGVFRGDVTLRQALHASLNLAPVHLTERLTPARVMAALRQAGAHPQLPGGTPGLAIALGGLGLSLQDLVQVYAALAQGGTAQPLHLEAGRGGAPLDTGLSRSATWHVGDILSGVQPPAGQPRGHVAFKTGTSYGHRDAWAIGWDGQHVVGVWLGRADGTAVPGIFGGDLAAPILFEAFERIAPRRAPLPPPPPETLIAPTALLPAPLQRFGAGSSGAVSDAVRFAFPPNGARIVLQRDQGLVVKLEGGTAPYAILANGVPVATGVTARELYLPDVAAGFATLHVVDAQGRSDSTDIRLDTPG